MRAAVRKGDARHAPPDGAADHDAVDRGAVQELFSSEAAAALDGSSLVQGAQLDECPILGGVSFQALVDSADLDVEVDAGSDRGFVSGSNDYLHYSCSVDTEEGPLTISASLTPFLDASEWLANHERRPATDVDYEAAEADGFAAGSLVRASDDGRSWPVWISDGLTIAPRFDGSFDDHLDLLGVTLDTPLPLRWTAPSVPARTVGTCRSASCDR